MAIVCPSSPTQIFIEASNKHDMNLKDIYWVSEIFVTYRTMNSMIQALIDALDTREVAKKRALLLTLTMCGHNRYWRTIDEGLWNHLLPVLEDLLEKRETQKRTFFLLANLTFSIQSARIASIVQREGLFKQIVSGLSNPNLLIQHASVFVIANLTTGHTDAKTTLIAGGIDQKLVPLLINETPNATRNEAIRAINQLTDSHSVRIHPVLAPIFVKSFIRLLAVEIPNFTREQAIRIIADLTRGSDAAINHHIEEPRVAAAIMPLLETGELIAIKKHAVRAIANLADGSEAMKDDLMALNVADYLMPLLATGVYNSIRYEVARAIANLASNSPNRKNILRVFNFSTALLSLLAPEVPTAIAQQANQAIAHLTENSDSETVAVEGVVNNQPSNRLVSGLSSSMFSNTPESSASSSTLALIG